LYCEEIEQRVSLPKPKPQRKRKAKEGTTQDTNDGDMPEPLSEPESIDNDELQQEEVRLPNGPPSTDRQEPPTSSLPTIAQLPPPASASYDRFTLQRKEILKYTVDHPQYLVKGVRRFDERPSSDLFMPRVVTCVGTSKYIGIYKKRTALISFKFKTF